MTSALPTDGCVSVETLAKRKWRKCCVWSSICCRFLRNGILSMPGVPGIDRMISHAIV